MTPPASLPKVDSGLRPPGPVGPVGPASPPGPAGRRRRHPVRRVVVGVLAVLIVLPGISFVRAMLYPGNAPASVRAVEWVRDHHGGSIVNLVENWVYSRQAPPATGAPAGEVLGGSVVAPTSSTAVVRSGEMSGPVLPHVRLLAGKAALRSEGAWRLAGTATSGAPALYTTWFRPDPKHTPVVAGVALIPKGVAALHLAGGTREPVLGVKWPEGEKVPAADRAGLVATFNAGFKTQDSLGGWYGDRRSAVPLVDGAASVVVHRDGSARIGAWGRDVRMTSDVVAVRQNLALTVLKGRPAPGVNGNNAHGAWGSDHNQFQYTWRSGLGNDARGNLVYVAGSGLTLATLTEAMVRVGVVTGMELDIHKAMVTFNTFTPSRSGPVGHKLLRAMSRPANRYLVTDQRDFFYVTAP